jgi:hypothetical protein
MNEDGAAFIGFCFGVLITAFVVFIASSRMSDHEVGMPQRVCMTIGGDPYGGIDRECIEAKRLIEILREQRRTREGAK